jgi:septation ring formation regulator EzrA
MTVEEQVTAVEQQVEEVRGEVTVIKQALEENTRLLRMLVDEHLAASKSKASGSKNS